MNTLEEKIQSDLVEATKERNEIRMNALKSIKAEITRLTTQPSGKKELEDPDVIRLIQRLAKLRKQTSEVYINADRKDLSDIELGELEILKTYLPEMLSEDRLIEIVEKTISDFEVTDMRGMGKIMNYMNNTYAGQFETTVVSKIVRDRLQK